MDLPLSKVNMKQKKQNPASREGGNIFCDITRLVQSPCCKILESISDGVFTINAGKRITSFNRAAEIITGFDQNEAVGQYCFDIFRADICEKNCALNQTLDGGESQINLPARIISKRGEPKSIRLSTAIMRNDAGKIIGAVETFRDVSELETLRRRANQCFISDDIVGRHPKIDEIVSFLPDIAESESTVIIEGPTGSGKELIARAIHQLSPRQKMPFIAVNCAALPDTLLESELFGYVKGAFTGAMRNKPGRFQLAHKGTLFLDEISNTSLNFQADLLRALQDSEITPLGSTRPTRVDVRIIAASNADLDKLTREEKFRRDLFYRLNVVRISLPALRDRKQDIPLLADHFIREFNIIKERDIQGISDAVLAFFMDYSFPGNVRELKNIIEFAFITCKGPIIEHPHLPRDVFSTRKPVSEQLSNAEHAEMERIRLMLKTKSRPETARALKISRTTLWRKMKKFGIIPSQDET